MTVTQDSVAGDLDLRLSESGIPTASDSTYFKVFASSGACSLTLVDTPILVVKDTDQDGVPDIHDIDDDNDRF